MGRLAVTGDGSVGKCGGLSWISGTLTYLLYCFHDNLKLGQVFQKFTMEACKDGGMRFFTALIRFLEADLGLVLVYGMQTAKMGADS